jgi:hypothetical protein
MESFKRKRRGKIRRRRKRKVSSFDLMEWTHPGFCSGGIQGKLHP